jgi:hypothetical protein
VHYYFALSGHCSRKVGRYGAFPYATFIVSQCENLHLGTF